MQDIYSESRHSSASASAMAADNRRELLGLLSRAVAHLYALAAACAGPHELTAELRAGAIIDVADMLMQAYKRLQSVPECAASVLEQCAMVSSVARAPLDGIDLAMVLTRSGLIINTWCTAATMLVNAADGPRTVGGVIQVLNTMQPDQRYQVALLERLSAAAYDDSAVRQLGTCYYHAFEGYSLLELHKLIGVHDMARARAVDLLDSASRGAMIAVRFLARTPLTESPEATEPEPTEPEPVPESDSTPAPEPASAPEVAQETPAPDHQPQVLSMASTKKNASGVWSLHFTPKY